MDGVEAVKLIHEINSDYAQTLPIIALTANAVAGNEQFFLDNGFRAFLSKPINLMKLDSVVRRWIMGESGTTETAAYTFSGDAAQPPVSGIEIEGVNAKLGLSIYDNDEAMYIDILRSFTEDIPAELDKLCVVDETSLPMYAINVHTVKGSAAGIGAKTTADTAMRLERMAKDGDLAGVLAENDSFVNSARMLIANIRQWLDK
jgi:CheY-like chemotaxis protein